MVQTLNLINITLFYH